MLRASCQRLPHHLSVHNLFHYIDLEEKYSSLNFCSPKNEKNLCGQQLRTGELECLTQGQKKRTQCFWQLLTLCKSVLHLDTASSHIAYTQSGSHLHLLEQMGYQDRQVKRIVNIFIQLTLCDYWQGYLVKVKLDIIAGSFLYPSVRGAVYMGSWLPPSLTNSMTKVI